MSWGLISGEGYYWLGFMFADGYFHLRSPGQKKASCIVLQLKGTDKEHIQKFLRFLGVDRPVYPLDNNGHPAWRVDIYKGAEKIITEVSENYSLQLKPKRLQFEDIPHEFRKDFLRGFLDGDGSVVWAEGRVKALQWFGESEMISLLKRYINEIVPPVRPGRIKKEPTKLKNGYIFRVEGQRARVLYSMLYSGAEVCLERKWKKEVAA